MIRNSSSPHAKLQSVDLDAVTLTDGFWAKRWERARAVTLPQLWELAGPWAWHNLRVAAGLEDGEARGCTWEDAWVYKWIEAACYFHAARPAPELVRQIDEIIAVIAEAQEPDGYIATQVTLRGRERLKRQLNHELYTMGHLMTAACAHHRITGKTSLLNVARRAADWAHKTYLGPDPMLANCPINPSIIMGAVELYRATGEERYLELANIIINNRGRERGPVERTDWGAAGGTDVTQDRVPLRDAKEVVGHAVFWSYLYAGAADAYMETGDGTLMTALQRLWTDLTRHKTYITGGVSPLHKGLSSRSHAPGMRTITSDLVHEAVGLPYELPNATAYNETCGQIGALMWNWRMLLITGEARFADTMERALYNAILSGVNVSGRGWSYTNPLRWDGTGHELLSNDFHQRIDPGERQICCPTNLLRTEASWNGCLYTTDRDGLWVHHYAASRIEATLPEGRQLALVQDTRFPWDGKVRLTMETAASSPFTLHLRIPAWADGATIQVNGEPVPSDAAPSSYVAIRRDWRQGDVVDAEFPMPVRLMAGHPKIEHVRGQVAVMRGPVVYCLESVDLPADVAVDDVHLPRNANWTVRHVPDLLGGVTVLETDAVVIPSPESDDLYRPLSEAAPRSVRIRMIPYFAWNNRGEPTMTVWLPLA